MRCKIQTALNHIDNRIANRRIPCNPVVSLVLRTRPKLARGNPFNNGVVRLCYRQGQLGRIYQTAVNNRANKLELPNTPPFVARPLWNGKGQWVDRFCVEHVDTHKRYLAFKPAQVQTLYGYDVQFIADQWLDGLTGDFLLFDQVQEYLLASEIKSQPMPPAEAVQWRTVALENILSIKCGLTYEIVESK